MERYFSASSIDALHDDGSHTITLEQYNALSLESHAARISVAFEGIARKERTPVAA